MSEEREVEKASSSPEPAEAVAASCSAEVEARFAGFWAATQSGHSLIAQLRKHRDFGNPYHLEEVISTFGIDDKGTCFPGHLWDPLALPTEGHASVLEVKQAQMEEARRQRMSQRTAVAFSKSFVETSGMGVGGLFTGLPRGSASAAPGGVSAAWAPTAASAAGGGGGGGGGAPARAEATTDAASSSSSSSSSSALEAPAAGKKKSRFN